MSCRVAGLSRTWIQPLESLNGGGALCLDGAGQTCFVGGTDAIFEFWLDVSQGQLSAVGVHPCSGVGSVASLDLPGKHLVPSM